MSDTGQVAGRGDVSLPAAFDTLHIATALHDPESGVILDANSRLESLYGYSTPELRTMRFAELSANTFPNTDQAVVPRDRMAAAADGRPQSFEWRIKSADGELIWVSIHLTRLPIAGRAYVLGEVTDITEYKHNDRRVSLFYRLLRHNLRNDINVISGFANHIEDVSEVAAAETAADKIETAATNLGRISESVKQIERTITGPDAERPPRLATGVITDVLDTFDSPTPATISVSERAEMWIAVDRAFDHALVHAVENAVVHSERADPSVDVVVDESPNTGRVEIRIEDEGPPIPEMEIEALDEHTETTSTSHGSGVGLFVMKWCIESLGGELKIERTPGEGNTVFFYLPPKEPSAATDPGAGVQPSRGPHDTDSFPRSTE